MSDESGRELLREMFRHNLWANRTLLEFCQAVPDDVLDAEASAAYGTPRDTLVHLAAAEEDYVALMSGQPPDPSSSPRPG